MKKTIILLAVGVFSFFIPKSSFAWGSRGHRLVGAIAFHFLDDSTRQKVQQYLGKMSFEDAATWMDDNRSNHYYDYMKPWHYVDIPKGGTLKDAPAKNMITILNAAINELQRDPSDLSRKDIKNDLLFIFHLTGDLHQPLHCGYPGDKGGNSLDVTSADFSSNLHSSWDTEIIEDKNITFYDCLKYYDSLSPEQVKEIDKINLIQWMNQSRALLGFVYDYKDGFLNKNYIDSATIIIEKQLLYGGMRLASILTKVMKNYPLKGPLVPIEKFSSSSNEIKTVNIRSLSDYEGETIKVCTKIIDGKYESTSKDQNTILNAPNDNLVILILEKDRNNFSARPEILYPGKNVCVIGRVETYKDNPTIIVRDEKQIIIQ